MDLSQFNFIFSEYDSFMHVADISLASGETKNTLHTAGEFIPLVFLSKDGESWYESVAPNPDGLAVTPLITTSNIGLTNNGIAAQVKVIGIAI